MKYCSHVRIVIICISVLTTLTVLTMTVLKPLERDHMNQFDRIEQKVDRLIELDEKWK